MKRVATATAIAWATAGGLWAQVQGNFKHRNILNVDRQQNPWYQQELYRQDQEPSQNAAAELLPGRRAGSFVHNDSVFTLVAHVMENVVAPEHVAVFSLVQVGLTVDSTHSLMEETLRRFIAELSGIGIPRDNVFIDMISFEPKYESQIEKKMFSKRAVEVPKGFELKKNVHVRYGDDQLFNSIMAAAAKAEIYDLIKVDYFVKDIDKVYDRLRTEALRIVENKRKAFATAGVVFDTTYNRTAYENMAAYYPADRYFDYSSAGAVSLDALKKKSSAETVKAEKIATQYYHKLPYNAFDMVINPVVHEPAVQFTYSLYVRYTLKRRLVDPKPKPLKPDPPAYYKLDENLKVVVPFR
jgi:uncharacterized protein YggE